MPQQVRETQRVPRSCIPCARRKVKCSRRIPCEQCMQRGDDADCIREVVKVGGKVKVAVDAEGQGGDASRAPSLLQENSRLRTRIRQLESALTYPELVHTETEILRFTTTPTRDTQLPERVLRDFQTQAFGLSLEPTTGSVNKNRPWHNNVNLILPTRRWSDLIVEFSLAQLGWVHCAVDETTFRKEHDMFWQSVIENEQACLTNNGWIAVYLSILAVGVYFMDEQEIDGLQLLYESFSSQPPSSELSPGKNPATWCRTWYDAALRELYLSDYTRKPAISTVQAVAILNLVHKNLGETSREYILHGMAVNIARLIGIDRLGEESPSTARENSNQAQLRTHRRLWWTLVICDWMTVRSRPISIHPHSFTTVLNVKDEQTSSPSKFEYHGVMARIAAMIRNQVISIREWGPGALKTPLEEIETICASFPPHLRYSGSPNDPIDDLHGANNEPYWNTLQRHLALNCVDSWRISLYVAIMPQVLDGCEPPNHTALDDGILAAKRILHRIYIDPNIHFPKFWSVNSGVVSAGIFLALDLICFQSYRSATQVAEQKDLVTLSFKILEQSSGQARDGGLLVLRRLCHLYETVLPAFLHKVDRSALARIIRLVASPRLWDSLIDTQATIRYLFLDSHFMSDRDGNCQSGSSSSTPGSCLLYTAQDGLSCDVPRGEMFDASKQVVENGQEGTLPYFGQFFPAVEFIDSSLSSIDWTLSDPLILIP